MRFEDAVVVVTGAARGIGRACASAFATEGARVALLDVELEAARATAGEVGPPDRCAGFACDVGRSEDVARAFDDVLERFGSLEVLVNNAGVGDVTPTRELSEEGWDRVVDSCLKGTFLCSQRAAGAMIERGIEGRIVNIASMLGLVQFPERAAYCSAKAGVVALTKVMACEWAPHGLRVNAIAPGYVCTEGVQLAIDAGGLDPTEILAWTPLARMGTPGEVAAAVCHLASAEADFMAGSVVTLDGGFSSHAAWWSPRAV